MLGTSVTNPAAYVDPDPALQGWIRSAVQLAKLVDTTYSAQQRNGFSTSVAIIHSPWHCFPALSMAGWPYEFDPTYQGPEVAAEINLFSTRLQQFSDYLGDANALYHTNVQVSAVLLDSEHYTVKDGDAAWNAALDGKYNPFYDSVKSHFPSAMVDWYNRGEAGWTGFTLNEEGDAYCCSLYRNGVMSYQGELFRDTCQNAVDHGVPSVTVWFTPGGSYPNNLQSYVWSWAK